MTWRQWVAGRGATLWGRLACQQVLDLGEARWLAATEVGELVKRDLDLAGIGFGVGINSHIRCAEQADGGHAPVTAEDRRRADRVEVPFVRLLGSVLVTAAR